MYKVDRRKLNRIQDDYHRIICIIRAIDNRFAVSPELLGVSEAKFNNYFQQLERCGAIERVEGTAFLPEFYNTNASGVRAFKRRGKLTFNGEINLGVVKCEMKYESK